MDLSHCLAFVLLFCLRHKLTVGHLSKDSANACVNQYEYTVMKDECQDVHHVSHSHEICWDLFSAFWCTKKEVVTETVCTPAETTEMRTEYGCCTGFLLSTDGNFCNPHCTAGCVQGQGTCESPDNCVCTSGYAGDDCSASCPSGKYGDQCGSDCQCENGAACNPVDGICHCLSGFTGTFCQTVCPAWTFGQSCSASCACVQSNSDNCNHVSGECQCKSGYRDSVCSSECPGNLTGAGCTQLCTCQNSGSCIPGSDQCNCTAGWKGEVCANECPPTHFGPNCLQECPTCYNGGTCDPVLGHCVCPSGFQGDHCENECAPYTWGDNCTQVCDCEFGQMCNPQDGVCRCNEFQSGLKCQNLDCPPGFYGGQCNLNCSCFNNATCDDVTGDCNCTAPGFTGPQCAVDCAKGLYGPNCSLTCNCTQDFPFCYEKEGCITHERARDLFPAVNCQGGTYGPRCAFTCQCTQQTPFCDPIDGCLTNAEALARYPPSSCPENWYGPNCSLPCQCAEPLPFCSPKDGCISFSDGLLHFPPRNCSALQYGPKCSYTCNCTQEAPYCNAMVGCMKIEMLNNRQEAGEKSSSDSDMKVEFSAALGLLILVVIAVVVAAGFFVIRRHRRKTMVAKPISGYPAKNGFVNPVFDADTAANVTIADDSTVLYVNDEEYEDAPYSADDPPPTTSPTRPVVPPKPVKQKALPPTPWPTVSPSNEARPENIYEHVDETNHYKNSTIVNSSDPEQARSSFPDNNIYSSPYGAGPITPTGAIPERENPGYTPDEKEEYETVDLDTGEDNYGGQRRRGEYGEDNEYASPRFIDNTLQRSFDLDRNSAEHRSPTYTAPEQDNY